MTSIAGLMAPPRVEKALPVKRACDSCHRRKVKCIPSSTSTCKNCISAGLICTYLAIPQKKGPKGSRAKVISELREKQKQVHTRTNSELELLSPSIITRCIDFFFDNLYPTQPILHRRTISEAVEQMDSNIDAYCLIVSLCGYMMIQPNMTGSMDGNALVQEALRVRRTSNYVEQPTLWSVITSFFLFGSFFCLDKHNTAWFYLREATTLAQIMGMHDEANYNSGDWIHDSRKRRLYWLLFVTERAYALQQHRPLTLHPTIEPPTLDDASEELELSGFIHLVSLFRPFDDTFVGLWNRARTDCTPEFLAQLQWRLSTALPADLRSTESQAVDLRCSQQWLRTMVWQLSISQGLLSSTTTDKAMSFQFPIDISRDLVAATNNFSQTAMEVHGIGLIEKLFDVACTLTDVMACVPLQPAFEYGPRDYLNQLTGLISTLRGGREKYLPLLMNKINETIPATFNTIPGRIETLDSGSTTPDILEDLDGSPLESPYSTPDEMMHLTSPLSLVNPYDQFRRALPPTSHPEVFDDPGYAARLNGG